MLKRLDRWLWEGSFEPQTDKLEVLTDSQTSPDDLVTLARKTLAELGGRVEELQQALQRRQRAEGRRPAGEGSGDVRDLAKSLLPSLDALDRIVELGEGEWLEDEFFQNWHKSVDALRTRLTKTLEGIGLQAMSSIGTEVDLEKHDVVGVVPAGEYPPNTVVSEQQKGYFFRGKLLRDARVIVAQ